MTVEGLARRARLRLSSVEARRITAFMTLRNHIAVMVKEVVAGLGRGEIFLDCTVGYGGHAEALLKNSGARLVGIDRDPDALTGAASRLAPFGGRVMLRHSNYKDFEKVLFQLKIPEVDGMLLDLGVSSPQFESGRGFSFRKDDPLDMRMDPAGGITASRIVNSSPERDLESIFSKYGEERYSRRYASAVVRQRPVNTARELASIIERSFPGKRGKIHPATRVFQALRIAVNDELASLDTFLDKFARYLKKGGRVAILSYHSLEDRLVKNSFRRLKNDGLLTQVTRKPVRPSRSEIISNPRARSAKLRIAERTTR